MANVIVLPSTNTWVTETNTIYASRNHIARSTSTVCYFVKLLQEHSSALATLAVTLFKVAAKTVFAATVAQFSKAPMLAATDIRKFIYIF